MELIIAFSILLAFSLFVAVYMIIDSAREAGVPILGVLTVVMFLSAALSIKFGVTLAEKAMYKQIRDDVNITSHKAYRKWLIDNPKLEK